MKTFTDTQHPVPIRGENRAEMDQSRKNAVTGGKSDQKVHRSDAGGRSWRLLTGRFNKNLPLFIYHKVKKM